MKGRFAPIVSLAKLEFIDIILQVRHSLNGRRLQSLPSVGQYNIRISRFWADLFRPYFTKNLSNTPSIAEIFHFVWTKNLSHKTAKHPVNLNFALQQGKKRKNNGFILSIFNAAAGQKALYRATYPYDVLSKGVMRMQYVTYSDLFQFALVITSIISVAITLHFEHKKK